MRNLEKLRSTPSPGGPQIMPKCTSDVHSPNFGHGRQVVQVLGLGILLGCLAAAPAAQGAEDPYDGNWHFSLTPYLWLPTTSGSLLLTVPPRLSGLVSDVRMNVDITPADILSHLDYGLMAAGDARKGRWSIATDFIGLSLSGDDSKVRSITGPGGIVEIPVDTGSKVGLKGFVWTLAGTYTVFNGPDWSMDVLAGFRDAQAKSSLDWHFSGPLGLVSQNGSFSRTDVLLDAIIGMKGRVRISESGHWFVPYYGDVGTGGAALTWQLAAGVGYAFDWGDLRFDYRALHYETDGKVLKDLTLHGPALAATFHF
jgi:hypothetical protein